MEGGNQWQRGKVLHLEAVADAEHGNPDTRPELWIQTRCISIVNRVRPSTQHNPLWLESENVGKRSVASKHFAVDSKFADPTSNQVRVLGSKVED